MDIGVPILSDFSDTLYEFWQQESILSDIFEMVEEANLSFPFRCNLFYKDAVAFVHNGNYFFKVSGPFVDVPDCSICLYENNRELKNIQNIFLDRKKIQEMIKEFVKYELKYSLELFDFICEKYKENFISINQKDLINFDDIVDLIMKSLDDCGGLGNILINPETMKLLKKDRLLNGDFLKFTLEEAQGKIIEHDCIPRKILYFLISPHNLGPMMFEGFSINKSKNQYGVFWNIVEHIGFMIANPCGIRKIIWS